MNIRKPDSSRRSSGKNGEFILMDLKATFMFQRGDDTELVFVLPWVHPAQHDIYICPKNHELGNDLIHPCALAAVMAVAPKRDTGVMQLQFNTFA